MQYRKDLELGQHRRGKDDLENNYEVNGRKHDDG